MRLRPAGSISFKLAGHDRRRHVLRFLTVGRAVIELDDRILALAAQALDPVAPPATERPLNQFVGNIGFF